MFPRFCKLCHQTVDESIFKLRRFSVNHVLSQKFNTEENEIKDQEFDNVNEFKKDNENKKVCIIKCKRTDFNFYEGDTYPKFEPIPLASRAWEHRGSKGDYFTIYPSTTNALPEQEIDKCIQFKDTNLNSELVTNLESRNIVHSTTIQSLGIPQLLNRKNVILTAETGCGKTFAFLLPLLHQILEWKPKMDRGCNRPIGLILTPSRELTNQIGKLAKKITKNLDINIVILVGGKTKPLMKNPPVGEVDLIVATIGVLSKLVTTNIYKMDQVRHVILDEADILFDSTFAETTCRFLKKISFGEEKNSSNNYPETAQLTLSSATVPENVIDLLQNLVPCESLIPITSGHEHQITVAQKFWRLGSSQKPMTLLKLIKPKIKSKIPIIIFSNNTATCDFIYLFLKQFNIDTIRFHGELSWKYRKGRFQDFQDGKCNILCTTDAGARGLDTTLAKDVINFDFPLMTSEYIHRCGRTGRIGSPKDCRIINFITRPLEIILTKKIEFAARKMKPIPMVDLLHRKDQEENDFITDDSKIAEKLVKYDDLNDDDDTDEILRHSIPQ